MIETDANRHELGVVRSRHQSCECTEPGGLAVGRVTKGVAVAIGKTLSVDRDAALPDRLASLVERLQAGPLGQSKLKSRRVA